ncbi:MAG: Stk1 family PASTA domain-containing Ser/Thr kinase [Streptosporangiales bacterium]|nr:Stk1 family PASTA domain-containing Ser/Thr kinase [Streptosporangiales bacterium]
MDTSLADAVIGHTLDGRYRVESRIARGGMASVYLGHDLRLDRQVALKIMHVSLADDEDFVARFIGEAKTVARLSHPNVVQVYDQGADSGYVYLAMEYVPGRTLRDLLNEQGRLAPAQALELMVPVLAALGAAHRAGLVHRDVKPENVLLSGDGRIKVADFGLARMMEGTANNLTKTGVMIGTVGYLAPEQVAQGTADARSDVYAAGIMLFELLTGVQPHTGETPLAVAYKHVNEVVPPPSTVVPGIPAPLDTLVQLVTAHDPGRRPADAGAFLRAVFDVQRGGLPTEVALAATPAAADPNSTQRVPRPGNQTLIVEHGPVPPEGPKRRVPRNRYPAVLVAAAVAVVAAAFGWWMLFGRFAEAPDLIGRSVTEAKSMATAQGLKAETATEHIYSDVESGKVAKTDPAAGDRIDNGGTIALFLSKGPRYVQMPKVAGKSQADAKDALREAGITDFKVEYEWSDLQAKNIVLSTSPGEGERADREDPVVLKVSRGFELPNVVGRQRGEAEAQLRQLGLNPAVTERQINDVPQGQVAEQNPRPGTGVSKGETVELVVSAGPEMVPIPDIRNWELKDAKKELKKLGFKVKEIKLGGEKVFNWSPQGQAPHGSEITVWTSFMGGDPKTPGQPAIPPGEGDDDG